MQITIRKLFIGLITIFAVLGFFAIFNKTNSIFFKVFLFTIAILVLFIYFKNVINKRKYLSKSSSKKRSRSKSLKKAKRLGLTVYKKENPTFTPTEKKNVQLFIIDGKK